MNEQSLGRMLCAALIGVGLALTGCSRGAPSKEGGEGSSTEGSSPVAQVTVTRVARADVVQTITLVGTIAALPNRDVRISALVPGRITELHVAEGDRVREGQVLARLDDRPIRDQLRQAEAALALALANLENAKLARARNEDLFQRGIAARKELEDARTQQNVAEAALRQADAALSFARLQLSRAQIVSPLTGAVAKRFVSVGEQVDGTAAQPIVEVASLEEVELIGNVPAGYLGKIHAGESLAITSESFAGKPRVGRVVAVSPSVDPSTNVGVVRIRMANSAGAFRLGMFLSAQVPLETHRNALVVPPQAIYRDQQGKPHVYRLEGETATAVEVTLGIETPERDELLAGVNAGDTLILAGGYGLGEKSKVVVKGAAQP